MNNGNFERHSAFIQEADEVIDRANRFIGEMTLRLVAAGKNKLFMHHLAKIGDEEFRKKYGFGLLKDDIDKDDKSENQNT